MQSTFNDDVYFEGKIAQLIDSIDFYGNVCGCQFERCSYEENKALQYDGVDVILKDDTGKTRNIDEKAASHWINTNLSTFAFEVMFSNGSGDERIGWLYDANKKTDVYHLLWLKADESKYPIVNKRNSYYKNMEASDIIGWEGCLLNRNKLIEFLSEQGMNENSIMEKARAYRNGKKSGFYEKMFEGGKLSYSSYYSEKPVNIIIKKDILFSLSCYKYKLEFNADRTPNITRF